MDIETETARKQLYEEMAKFKIDYLVELGDRTEGDSGKSNDDESPSKEKEEEEEEEEEEEVEEEEEEVKKAPKEWWKYDPYFTPALRDKLEPYIEKLKKRPSWAAYDKLYKSLETVELSLKEQQQREKEWEERENPRVFWEKQRKMACKMEETKKNRWAQDRGGKSKTTRGFVWRRRRARGIF